jgi:hypothetical protein
MVIGWRRGVLLALWLGIAPTPSVAAQGFVLDPDWRLWSKDSREHFAAGAGVGVATRAVLPGVHPWRRVAVIAAIALAWELGQEDALRPTDRRGWGYGFGTKDWLLSVLGGAVAELLIGLLLRARRR